MKERLSWKYRLYDALSVMRTMAVIVAIMIVMAVQIYGVRTGPLVSTGLAAAILVGGLRLLPRMGRMVRSDYLRERQNLSSYDLGSRNAAGLIGTLLAGSILAHVLCWSENVGRMVQIYSFLTALGLASVFDMVRCWLATGRLPGTGSAQRVRRGIE